MKTITGTVALFLLLLASCGDSKPDKPETNDSQPNKPEIKVGPGNTVSWEDAKTILKERDVKSVFQRHSGEVKISMADGTTYTTQEPQIDDVIRWLEECGKRDSVAIITE